MKNLTPSHLRCAPGLSCPAVHEDGDDLVIVGRREHPSLHPDLNVEAGEEIIRISKAYMANVVPERKSIFPFHPHDCDCEDILAPCKLESKAKP